MNFSYYDSKFKIKIILYWRGGGVGRVRGGTLTYLKNVSNGTFPFRGQRLCKISFEIHA